MLIRYRPVLSLVGACSAVGFLSASPDALSAASCMRPLALQESLQLTSGIQQELRLPDLIERVAVGNPQVADVQLTGERSFLVTAVQGGVTNLTVWSECGDKPWQTMVFVTGAATAALTPSDRDGTVPNTVQTDIRFVEVSRTKLREVGISMLGTGNSNFLYGSPGSTPGSVPVGRVGELNPGMPLPLRDSGFNIVWGGGSSKVLAAVNALEGSGFAYTLSRPSLVAMSGQSASFLAGGEFPVPVPTSGSDSFSIQYKEFGVRLNLTPTIVDRNRIVLKVAPEVSELDFNNGVTIGGTSVPALTIRRTDTSVSLADGESFVISGLVSTSNQAAVDRLPGLGNLPVLGAFFRSSRIDREERELLMIVTPHLVQPLGADAELPELPGQEMRNYEPSLFEQLFDPDDEFNRIQGLSR